MKNGIFNEITLPNTTQTQSINGCDSLKNKQLRSCARSREIEFDVQEQTTKFTLLCLRLIQKLGECVCSMFAFACIGLELPFSQTLHSVWCETHTQTPPYQYTRCAHMRLDYFILFFLSFCIRNGIDYRDDQVMCGIIADACCHIHVNGAMLIVTDYILFMLFR